MQRRGGIMKGGDYMKALKVMSIIGIVWTALCFMFIVMFANQYDWEASTGWGIYLALYSLPLSIVGLVQANKKK